MPTNGVSIPDDEKVEIPEGEEVDEATWVELTNHRGITPEEDLKILNELKEELYNELFNAR